MEKSYIILYDLKEPYYKYEHLINAIKAYGTWGRLTETSWVIVSSKNTEEIATSLHSYIKNGDRLIVIRSGRDAAWYNSIADNNWIKEQIIK